MSSPVGPTAEPERISSLDTLRGFALLGILAMNIWSFGMPFAAYFNPTAYGDLTGANWWAWLLSHVLADQKFMTLFSMLFGAGIVLMTTRVAERGESPARLHYRRMMWLLLFGLVHAYLVWYGDILVLYALCGMFVYPCRKLSPRTLVILGLLVISVSSLISLAGGLSMPYWPESEVTKLEAEHWRPPQERIEQELAAYRGGWLDQMPHRVNFTLEFHSLGIWIWGVWRAGGLMLVGMALYKWGVLSAARSRAFYATCIAAGALLGIPLILYGVHRNIAAGWSVRYSFFLGAQWNYWGSLLVSGAWLGVILLLCKMGALAWLTSRLNAVGRMAFTNYLLHTIICTTIFYGHGFGLFGTLDRSTQLLVVFGVWIFQLVASPLWLRRFRFGPFEWAWRSLTYGARQPFRRDSAAPQ